MTDGADPNAMITTARSRALSPATRTDSNLCSTPDRRAGEWLATGSFFEWSPPQPTGAKSELRIFHAEFGDPDAPILVLLHGFPTSSVDWYDVVGPLSRERRVCVLDLPGFGFSDKPKGERHSLQSDSELLAHYLTEIVGAQSAAVVAHDRGDSVALVFAERCALPGAAFELSHLVLSNGNMFLPLSNLTEFQRLVLDPKSAAQVLEALTPEMLAAGMGQSTFTPPRSLDDPTIAALAQTFAFNDGIGVLHDTIQYLVERSQHERAWLEALCGSTVATTLVWGLHDLVAPVRVANHIWATYLAAKPGTNEFWLLPRANHYLQNDQPQEFAEVVLAALSRRSPITPGPLSAAGDAPILVDRSRTRLPSAAEVLGGA
jgi:pimeloyl-ACP methyl ester carboxylesterase